MYITLDGPDHSGKSTQIPKIKELILSLGIAEENILLVREPGGSPNADKIRALLLDSNGLVDVCPSSELLLMTASRYELQDKVIKPFIKQMGEKGLGVHEWCIISDRSLLASYAYQCHHGEEKAIFNACHFNGQLVLPDLSLVFTITREEAQLRKQREGSVKDRIELKDNTYQEQVHQLCFDLGVLGTTVFETSYSWDIVPISAMLPVEEVSKEVRRAVYNYF